MKNVLIALTCVGSLIALIILSTGNAYAEQSINLGLFTEHYESDRKDYNEDNRLVQYMYEDDGYTLTASTFINSHFDRSYSVGAGYEWDDTVGVYLAAVYGYEDHLKTHYKGLIFIPVFYVETFGFRHTIMGPVYNLGYTIKF